MKLEVKKEWLAALRGGHFEQTEGVLTRFVNGIYSYCPLGVLCGLALADGIVQATRGQVDGGIVLYDGHTSTLPEKVMTYAGLYSNNPKLELSDGSNETISNLNDRGCSFTFIADLIEAQL